MKLISDDTKLERNWLAVVAGNSRLHWGWFERDLLQETWDTNHLANAIASDCPPSSYLTKSLSDRQLNNIPVYFASVVARQTEYWQSYQHLNKISLSDLALTNTYPTFGIDRALTAFGAVSLYRQDCLIIDGGTALTFTGVDRHKQLIGGAILPGLRSQLTTLEQTTSALPDVQLPQHLPSRWAVDTDTAIASGILYTVLAGVDSYIADWRKRFPNGRAIFTGGDGKLLANFYQQQFNAVPYITLERNLIFQGFLAVYRQGAAS